MRTGAPPPPGHRAPHGGLLAWAPRPPSPERGRLQSPGPRCPEPPVSTLPAWLPALLVPVAFPVMWLSICTLFGRLSGWHHMARHYALPAEPPGVSTQLAGGRVGLVQYKGVLWVGADDAGLVLGVLLLWRRGHPWLRIPWERVRTGERGGFLTEAQTLHIDAGGHTVDLRLGARTADALLARRP